MLLGLGDQIFHLYLEHTPVPVIPGGHRIKKVAAELDLLGEAGVLVQLMQALTMFHQLRPVYAVDTDRMAVAVTEVARNDDVARISNQVDSPVLAESVQVL